MANPDNYSSCITEVHAPITESHSPLMPPPPPPLPPSSPDSVIRFPGENYVVVCPVRKVSFQSPNTVDSPQLENTTTIVRFYPQVLARDIPSHRDMSPEEHRDCWIQSDEHLATMRRNAKAIRAIEKSYDTNCSGNKNNQHEQDSLSSSDSERSFSKNEKLCPRGLENGLRCEMVTREAYRIASFEEVFKEQEKQFYEGIYDDELMAEACSKITHKCSFRAHLRALLDRREVEDYYSSSSSSNDNSVRSPKTSTKRTRKSNKGKKLERNRNAGLARKHFNVVRMLVRFTTRASMNDSNQPINNTNKI